MLRVAADAQLLGGTEEKREQLGRRPAGETHVCPAIVVDPATPDGGATVVG